MMRRSGAQSRRQWLGRCKSDQKPGDLIIPGMGKFTAQDMRECMQNMPKPQ